MSETTLLESRVDKIERDNRRLKLALGALLLALAAVPLIGAVMPEQIPEVIRARNFFVYDGNDNIRIGMDADGIGYQDENGNLRLNMNADGFRYRDENETLRAVMDSDGFFYIGEGTIRAAMTAEGIAYGDENGNQRAQMSDAGITYRDENRNVVWSTRCTPNC